jgi:hypothetical protein
MAYVVATKRDAFEVRESRSTPNGPRSRTLATFRELDAATIERVRNRAETPPSEAQLRKAALRAGAPIAGAPVDAAARTTLRSLAHGERPSPKLRRLLLDALADKEHPATEWLGASLSERGETLEQLLLLTDALPIRRRRAEIGFPRLSST